MTRNYSGELCVPVELWVGVLIASVIANLTLLLWLSRADHVKVHWSGPLRSATDSMLARPPEPEAPPVRRRALFVAERATVRDPAAASQPTSSSPGPPDPKPPLAEMLPPDLAQLLSRPASIAPHPNGFDKPRSGDGDGSVKTRVRFGEGDGPSVLARLPVQPRETDAGFPVDPLTGLEGPDSWSRIMAIENARLLRYRRPVAVVMAEVEGLRRLSERLGDEPVDRLLPVIADAFRREARATDWVARIATSRFAAFLPETDEIQAIHYVERIRIVCEPWLASAAVPLRLAIGWSSPSASSDLEFAILRAEERMHADRRMPGKAIQPPRVVPARVVSLPPAGPVVGDAADDLPAAVPPAETGRSGEWIRSQTAPGDTVQVPEDDVSRVEARQSPHR